jgi:hypothetical protein
MLFVLPVLEMDRKVLQGLSFACVIKLARAVMTSYSRLILEPDVGGFLLVILHELIYPHNCVVIAGVQRCELHKSLKRVVWSFTAKPSNLLAQPISNRRCLWSVSEEIILEEWNQQLPLDFASEILTLQLVLSHHIATVDHLCLWKTRRDCQLQLSELFEVSHS